MIAEWRKGCSNAGPMNDTVYGKKAGSTEPEQCRECTRALIDAIEAKLREDQPAGGEE